MSPRSPGHPPVSRFRSDIQGLRALAVLLVLLYHAHIPLFTGGFVGVDIFFVISGFLITGGLLRGIQDHGRVDLLDFYGRRARRILPAALLALVGVVAMTLAFLPRSRWDAIFTEATGSALSVVNWIFAQASTDYLRQDEAASPVQHFWSLAVEEQFYVFWPLLLLGAVLAGRRLTAAHRRPAGTGPSFAVVSRRFIVGAAVLLFVLSLAHAVTYTAVNPGAAYFATTTRTYELAIGALVAIFADQLARVPRRAALVLGWAGLAAMLMAGLGYDSSTVFPGAAALLPTLGAAAVIVAGMDGRQQEGVGALLSLRPVTWVGDISYSLYLWHWPLIVVATYLSDGLGWRTGLVAIVVSVLPAWLSYRFVEKPFQAWRWVRPPARAIRVGLAGTAAVVVVAVSLDVYSSRSGPTAWASPTYDASVQEAATGADAPPVGMELLAQDPAAARPPAPGATLVPALGDVKDDLPESYGEGCIQGRRDVEPAACVYGPDDAEVRIALVGDSHAGHWIPALTRLAAENDWQVRAYVKTSCPFTAGTVMYDEETPFVECSDWNAATLDEIKRQDVDLVLSSTSKYDAPAGETVPEGMATAWRELADAGIPHGVLVDPASPRFNVTECMEENPEDLAACSFAEDEAEWTGSFNQREALEAVPSSREVDLTPWICPEGTCPATIGGVVVWRDSNHLTATFADSAAPVLGTVLREEELVPAP
ncbi:acyltransferase [Citricoccus sp. SGAir0253]|uniref:acyltransferase family protein n=1 Tax=Citricoccus sp. SGAir0253 TaxID=2567881 RepID=UPI0010CD5B1F|nr:acyltransferase family protein [Citricoccus sp. SGAir0253]QCU77108.1 acyltransferase [Citricoccus sp. SGAir0253]